MSHSVVQLVKKSLRRWFGGSRRPASPIRRNPPSVRLEGPELLEGRTPATSLNLFASVLPS